MWKILNTLIEPSRASWWQASTTKRALGLLGSWKRDRLVISDAGGTGSDIDAAQEARREDGAKPGLLAKSGLL